MDSKIRLQSPHSINDWRRPAQQVEKRAPYGRPDTGASLILISLLSLGLWAAVWGTVASLAAALR